MNLLNGATKIMLIRPETNQMDSNMNMKEQEHTILIFT